MKNKVTHLLMILCLVASVTAIYAANPHHTWDTPMIAAKHDKNVVKNLRKYLREGFELTDEYENAYRYLVPPTGDYLWGTCHFNLKREAGNFSLEVTYIRMTAYIDYLEESDGFKCSGFDLREETVY